MAAPIPRNEICPKCDWQENTLIFCAGGTGAMIGCLVTEPGEHIHVSCTVCKAQIRAVECHDA